MRREKKKKTVKESPAMLMFFLSPPRLSLSLPLLII
jgi:hypothetical protein